MGARRQSPAARRPPTVRRPPRAKQTNGCGRLRSRANVDASDDDAGAGAQEAGTLHLIASGGIIMVIVSSPAPLPAGQSSFSSHMSLTFVQRLQCCVKCVPQNHRLVSQSRAPPD